MPTQLQADPRHRVNRIRRACACVLVLCGIGLAHAQPNEDLAIAAFNDRAAQVKDMLAKGADANAVNNSGEPVLVVAARSNATGSVDVLLAAGAKVNGRTPNGDSALMAAAINGNLEVAKKLRQKGAELEGAQWTPLIYAATGGKDAMVTYLLAEGANINATSANGTTALMMAVRESRYNVVTLLIAKGANVNKRNENGASALSWAVRGNDQTTAEALKRAGATQ